MVTLMCLSLLFGVELLVRIVEFREGIARNGSQKRIANGNANLFERVVVGIQTMLQVG